MKQRVARGSLLLLVALVWGAVIVRAFKRPQAEVLDTTSATSVAVRAADSIPSQATRFALTRDPFLDEEAHPFPGPAPRPRQRAAGSGTPRRTSINEPRAASWPAIAYSGMMRGIDRSAVAMLSINGKNHVLREGGMAEGVTLLAITADSITLGMGGGHRTWRRE